MIEHEISEAIKYLLEESTSIDMPTAQCLECREYSSEILSSQVLDDIIYEGIFDKCECVSDMLSTDFAIDRILFEESECITESSSCDARDELYSFFFCCDFFLFADVLEPSDDIFFCDFPEVESQCTRSDRLGDFFYLSRREDELHMWWWFFESFE